MIKLTIMQFQRYHLQLTVTSSSVLFKQEAPPISNHKLKVRQAVGSVSLQLLCLTLSPVHSKQGTLVATLGGMSGWRGWGGLLCTRCRLSRCLPGEISSVTRAGN